MRILTLTLCVLLAMGTSSCGRLRSSPKIFGTVRLQGLGCEVGCADELVYVFSREQIDGLIATLTSEFSRRPTAEEVFARLPLGNCVAKTEIYGCRFKLKLGLEPGRDLVLAVDGQKYPHYFIENGRLLWAEESNC